VPGILTKTEEFDLWLEDETVALRLQRSLPRILKRREKDDSAPAIISPRILKRRGTPPSEPSAKLTRPHNWDRHARHPRRCGLEPGLIYCSAAAKPQTTGQRLLHTFDYW
jgi:hypothetical protein